VSIARSTPTGVQFDPAGEEFQKDPSAATGNPGFVSKTACCPGEQRNSEPIHHRRIISPNTLASQCRVGRIGRRIETDPKIFPLLCGLNPTGEELRFYE